VALNCVANGKVLRDGKFNPIDALAVGNLYKVKSEQGPRLKRDYKGAFELD
jgi:hypothetical protein